MRSAKRGARRLAASGLLLTGLLALVLASGASGAPGDATATRVADINPGDDTLPVGPDDSSPSNLFNAAGTLLFVATDGLNGNELWKSNGGPLGPGGTEMLEDDGDAGGIADGSGSSNPSDFASIGATVFFAAQDAFSPTSQGKELWKIDPPYTTPVLVENINPAGGQGSSPQELTAVGTTLLFQANDGAAGEELWKSVPPYNAGSTSRVSDINQTPASSASSFPQQLTNVNGTLFFSADDGNGFEVWKSEASFTTATMVKDIDAGGSAVPNFLTAVGSTLFFVADDGDGDELWKSVPPYDSSPTSTMMVKDINTNLGTGSNPQRLTDVNGTLFFGADDGGGFELWKSAGPAYDAGSTSEIDINPTGESEPGSLANINGTLYFAANDGVNGEELWKSNGGPVGTGTVLVADVNPSGSSGPIEMTLASGQVFFLATQTGINNRELFKSSGTGATLVDDINDDPNSSSFQGVGTGDLTDVNGTLFFGANDGLTGRELWKATVEPASVVVTPVTPTPTAAPSNAFTIGSLKGKTLTLNVSSVGTASVDDQGATASAGAAVAATKNLLKPSSASGGPGSLVVKLKLTKPAQATLNRKGKLKVKAKVTFTPTGGTANTQTAKLKLKK